MGLRYERCRCCAQHAAVVRIIRASIYAADARAIGAPPGDAALQRVHVDAGGQVRRQARGLRLSTTWPTWCVHPVEYTVRRRAPWFTSTLLRHSVYSALGLRRQGIL